MAGKPASETVEWRSPYAHVAMDHDLQAFKAYLHVMLSDDAPQLDSLEHRAVMLMRDLYPSTRRESGNSKLFMTRQRVFMVFKERAGRISLPDSLINEIGAGLRKMSAALVLVGDSTAYGCGIATDVLEEAINKLLVMNESALTPHAPTTRAA